MYNLKLNQEELNALLQLTQHSAAELQTMIEATPKTLSEPVTAHEVQNYLKGRRSLLLGIKFPEAYATKKG